MGLLIPSQVKRPVTKQKPWRLVHTVYSNSTRLATQQVNPKGLGVQEVICQSLSQNYFIPALDKCRPVYELSRPCLGRFSWRYTSQQLNRCAEAEKYKHRWQKEPGATVQSRPGPSIAHMSWP
jgi:hypothetical protein